MNEKYKRTVEPVVEPVSLSDLQAHLLVSNSDDDAYLTALISVARSEFEKLTGMAIIDQTWELTLPYFPLTIAVRKPPLRSITSITYYDVNGTLQTLTPSTYRTMTAEYFSTITEAYGKSWPTTEYDRADAVQVTFKAGIYQSDGASPEAVDTASASYLVRNYALAQHAIKILAAHLYENRGIVVTGSIVSTYPMAYQSIVNACKVSWI